jgi:hypothetical protein
MPKADVGSVKSEVNEISLNKELIRVPRSDIRLRHRRQRQWLTRI